MAEEDEERPKVGPASVNAGGVSAVTWEWNISLAAQRLTEAEAAFQSLLQKETSVPAAVNKEEDRFDENPPNDANASSPNYAPPRRNRFIAPHRRPRATRLQYRLSPLEPIDDEKLIPNLQIENIASAIPAAVERERLFEQHPLPLLVGKRLWCYDGLDYDDEHPYKAYGGGLEEITPDDWAEDYDEEGGKRAWPLDTPYNASVVRLCWNYFLFQYKKSKNASHKVVFWEIIASFISPACSLMYGSGLIDELNSGTSRGESPPEQMKHVMGFAAGIFLLHSLGLYLKTQPNHCGYSINGAPCGAARAGLRDTLFHRMRHLKSPLKDKITPGGASGIICDKVFETVNIYYSFLSFPSLVTGALAEFVVSWSSLRNVKFTGVLILPTVAVIVLSLIFPLVVNAWYQPELCILTRLEHQWMLRLRAVAGSAIPIHVNGKSSGSKSDTDSNGSDNKTEEDSFRKIFHQCSYLENMRHFHAWKMTVVILFLIGFLTKMGIAIVTICAAYAVINGSGVSVGNFSTLVASVTGIVKLGEEMGSFFTSMYENHTMLKQITCIMNDEDIGFDGGTDPFGSAHTHLMHAHHHLHLPHLHHHHDDVDLKLDLTKSDISNM